MVIRESEGRRMITQRPDRPPSQATEPENGPAPTWEADDDLRRVALEAFRDLGRDEEEEARR